MSTAPSTTSFSVNRETFADVMDDLVATLNHTRKHAVDDSRFRWLYCQNPDGPAVIWTVRDSKSGAFAGFTAAVPRRVMVNGQVKMAWNGADFSMHPQYRTLGPAIKLRRAAKDDIDSGKADFLYAHPNDRMAVIHSKVGHELVGRMVRFARPLRTGVYLAERLKSQAAGKAVAALVDPCLRIRNTIRRRRTDCRMKVADSAIFDDRFDQLFEASNGSQGVVGVRDCDYLRWRYQDNPLYHTHSIIAEQGQKLRGYLLFTIDDQTLVIKDIYPPDAAIAHDLLQAVIREGHRRRLTSISAVLLESNPLVPALAQHGFRLRPDSSQVFGYAPVNSPIRDSILSKDKWFLTVGDRDV